MSNIFEDNLNRLKKVQQLLDLDEKSLNLLSKPAQIQRANLEVSGKTYPAWRVVFNRALGPGKGGIRFHHQVSEDEVVSLSFWMSIKNSLADIPYGGGKGGVKVNPKELTEEEKEDLSRQYIVKFHNYLGQDKDIPAPDVYTNSQIMSWMLDEFEKQTGKHEPGMITGKPIELGGLEIRKDATAKGGYIVTKEIIKNFFSDKKGLKFAIQGFGNAGSYLAKMLSDEGHIIVAVSDSKGAIYNEDGLDVEKIIEIKSKGLSVIDYKEAEKIEDSEILTLSVDFLVLAALENQITKENVEDIKSKYILELANGPIDNYSDEVLFKKGVVIIPDILANSGGVIASYFEWSQNRTGNILDNNYLEELLEKKMKTNLQRVLDESEKYSEKVSLRMAAYALAIKKILKAEKYRGNLK